jgi:hypothetical protein
MSVLLEAIHQGDLQMLERLIGQGADLNPAGSKGRSPLHEAMRLGKRSAAELLISAGADVNAKVGDGYAPLRIALAAHDKTMAETLIAAGADVNTTTRFGETPLHAVHDPSMAEMLLGHGADVHAKAIDGGTPLHYAAWWDRRAVARLLIKHGSDVNSETIYGETPLVAARTSSYRVMPVEGDEAVADLLARHGAVTRELRDVPTTDLDPRILRPYLKICDGLIPPELIAEAWSRLNQPIWGFGLGTFQESHYKHARTSISLTDPMVTAISRLVEPKLPYACRLISVYANANRTGDADEVHKDGDEPGYPSAIFYANPQWQCEWAGETVFYNEVKDEFVRSVYPRPGRVGIFDGRIWHNARVPSRHYGGIRVTVVFNYEHTAFGTES